KKSRERTHRSAAQWLTRLKGGEGKAALHLPPDFVLWVFAGLLAHLDHRGDTHVADLAESALIHGGGLSVHGGTRWHSARPARDEASDQGARRRDSAAPATRRPAQARRRLRSLRRRLTAGRGC